MPCFYDYPQHLKDADMKTDCMRRMFYEIKDLLTENQFKDYELYEILIRTGDYFSGGRILCKTCKILTVEQMKAINATLRIEENLEYMQKHKDKSIWPYKTLLDWYKDHLKKDIGCNEKERDKLLGEIEIAQSELKRIY